MNTRRMLSPKTQWSLLKLSFRQARPRYMASRPAKVAKSSDEIMNDASCLRADIARKKEFENEMYRGGYSLSERMQIRAMPASNSHEPSCFIMFLGLCFMLVLILLVAGAVAVHFI